MHIPMKAAQGDLTLPSPSSGSAFMPFLLPLIVLVVSCGLPSVPYLHPPSDFDVSPSSIKITNNMENFQASEGSDQSYRGLEIYYHAYESPSAAAIAHSQLENLASSYEKSSSSYIKIVTGTTYKFKRLRNANFDSPALIPVVNPALPVSYYINISQTGFWRITDDNNVHFPSGDTGLSSIIRNVANRVPANPGFHAMDFQSGDEDYTGSSLPSTVYILMFGVSYGLDPMTIGVPIYSAPLLDPDVIVYSSAG